VPGRLPGAASGAGVLRSLLTKKKVTTSMAGSGRSVGMRWARGKGTNDPQESRARFWTWLGAQGCSPRAVGQSLCHLGHWEGKEKARAR
jgi:hypothetical protein